MTFVVFNVLFTFSFDKNVSGLSFTFLSQTRSELFLQPSLVLGSGKCTEMPQYALLLFLSIFKSSLVGYLQLSSSLSHLSVTLLVMFFIPYIFLLSCTPLILKTLTKLDQ